MERKRRQRAITTIVVVVVIIAVVVSAVAFLPRSSNAVPLPAYLDHCVTGSLNYHSHPGLVISINGANFPIPALIGIQSACDRPIHTHPASGGGSVFDGTLHVETDDNRDYTLGDFFLIWGNWANSKEFSIFNSTQIFNNKVDATHSLTVTVNNSQDSRFENIPIPRDADPNNKPFSIVLTYGQAAATS